MIAVFDTNVLVAALTTEGLCFRLLRRARARDISLALCPCIINELIRILSKKFGLSNREVSSAVELVKETTTHFTKSGSLDTTVSRDPDDDYILACAIAARAEYIVTGDADLLVIKKYKNIKIVSPRDFETLFD